MEANCLAATLATMKSERRVETATGGVNREGPVIRLDLRFWGALAGRCGINTMAGGGPELGAALKRPRAPPGSRCRHSAKRARWARNSARRHRRRACGDCSDGHPDVTVLARVRLLRLAPAPVEQRAGRRSAPLAYGRSASPRMLGAIDFRRASKPTVNPRMFSGEVKLRFSTQKGFLDAIDHQFRLFNHQEMASIGHIFDRVVVIPACDEIRPN